MESLTLPPIKRKFGYARVSTKEQSVDNQIERLEEYGIDKDRIYTDVMSGKEFNREGLNKLLNLIEENDHIVLTKLDRLGRNLIDTLKFIEQVKEKKATIHFLDDNVNTRDPIGDFIIPILSMVASWERKRIVERTTEGRQKAKQRGVKFGRPQKLKYETVKELLDLGKSQNQISKICNVSRNAVSNCIKRSKV